MPDGLADGRFVRVEVTGGDHLGDHRSFDGAGQIALIPAVGELNLTYEAVDLPTDDLRGLNLTIYTAQPGSISEDQIKLLASWTATSNHAQAKAESAKASGTT